MDSPLFRDVQRLVERLGLPVAFYGHLLKEDDWSFTIKINALFEAACTHVLARKMKAEAVEDCLAHLPLADGKFGKVALLRGLGSITSEQAKVLRTLAELRNHLVHRIENVSFSYSQYIAKLNKDKRRNFAEAFAHGLIDPIVIEGTTIPRQQFVLENPQLSIWLTCSELLACLYLEVPAKRQSLWEYALKLAPPNSGDGT